MGAINPTPLKPTVGGQRSLAFYGDSITARAFSFASPNTFRSSGGYATWVNILTRQRFYSPDTYNFGVNGDTTAQMLARLSSVLAVQPDCCVVLGGTNDLPGNLGYAVTVANLTAIYNALAAIGCVIIAVPITGRSGSNVLTSAQRLVGLQVNEWIRRQALARKNFVVADCGLTFDDPLSTAWAERTGYTDDNLHPNGAGAYAIGNKIVTALNTIYPDFYVPVGNPTDLYDATNNPTGNLLPGGMFTGTGGTTNSPATGTTATNWTTTSTSLLGATCAMSVLTLADGRPAQRITLSGTYTGSTGLMQLQAPGLTAGNLAAGDVVEGAVEFALAASSTNIAGIDLYFQSVEGGTTYQHHGFNSILVNPGVPAAGFSGIIKTPPRTITATPSSIAFVIRVNFVSPGSASAIAAVADFYSASLRKL